MSQSPVEDRNTVQQIGGKGCAANNKTWPRTCDGRESPFTKNEQAERTGSVQKGAKVKVSASCEAVFPECQRRHSTGRVRRWSANRGGPRDIRCGAAALRGEGDFLWLWHGCACGGRRGYPV